MMAMGLPVVVSDVDCAAEMVLPGGDRPSIPSGDPMSSVNFLLTLSEPLNRETVGRVASQFVAAKCSTVTETY
jgi:L-malate glycosyltransferase